MYRVNVIVQYCAISTSIYDIIVKSMYCRMMLQNRYSYIDFYSIHIRVKNRRADKDKESFFRQLIVEVTDCPVSPVCPL